jgi:4-hydroxybenzoate polyprenyltransferase
VLGWSLAIAPVGGYLAVVGSWSRPAWMLLALAVAVAAWVGGFDIFYSLQDIEFDRANDLHSVPAAVGVDRAVSITRALHVTSVIALGAVGVAVHGGAWYWVGVVLAAALLAYEHSLVRGGDLSKLDAAFFTMNGMISILFFFFVLMDRLVRAGMLGR